MMSMTSTMAMVNQSVSTLETNSTLKNWKEYPEDDANTCPVLTDSEGNMGKNSHEDLTERDANGKEMNTLTTDVQTPQKTDQRGCEEIIRIEEDNADLPSIIEGAEDCDEDGSHPPLDLERITPQRTISNISAVSVGASSVASGCGASTDGSTARSRAESIRARLREKERLLSEMVHRQTNVESVVEDKFKQEMVNVKSNLDKVEQEKYALEQKLEFLKNQQLQDQAVLNSQDVTDHDAFLRDKLNGIQRGFQEQASRIQALENEIATKNAELDEYRHEIASKLKRIIELEFDLEMHEIHYTDYAKDQMKLGEEVLGFMSEVQKQDLEKTFKQTGDGSEEVLSRVKSESENCADAVKSRKRDELCELYNTDGVIDDEKTNLTPKRAQKLIAKLLRDLDQLEATYKKDKLKSTLSKEKLKNENEELRTKIYLLEQEQKNKQNENKNGKSSLKDVSGYMSIYQLRKRIETLEAKRFLYRKEISRLHEEMKEFQNDAKTASQRLEIEVDRLKLELEAAKLRYSFLCKDQNGADDKIRENNCVEIEQKIVNNYEMIAKLRSSSEIKDRQIASLKDEINKLRMQDIAKGKTGNNYKQMDVNVLKAETNATGTMGEDEDSEDAEDGNSPKANVSASFVTDLQRQLLVAHEQLVKKDQELVIERAKSACMAANLLDRIAELDKEAERNKRRESSKASHDKVKSREMKSDGEGSVRGTRMTDREGSIRGARIFDKEGSVRGTRVSDKEENGGTRVFDKEGSVRSSRFSIREVSSRSSRSVQVDESGEKKPKKKMSSLIPFLRKKDHGDHSMVFLEQC